MLGHLTTEARNPASEAIDTLSPLEIVRLMNAEDARVAEAVGREAERIAQGIEIIADRLRQGGRLVYVGAGTSGRLGVLDASECPPTFNTRPEQVVGLIAGGPSALTRSIEGAEDDPQRGAADLEAANVSAADVVVGIATSGRTPYVVGALQFARQRGAFTIGLSCNADSGLAGASDLTITPVVGPEVVSGSTRLKAGTATKMVLNMLTTGAMVRLGKTYGNLMVDLRASNRKLADRAGRIVTMLTSLDDAAAVALLQRCGGELKTAIVAQTCSVSPDDARVRLASADGQLRRAMQNVGQAFQPDASDQPPSSQAGKPDLRELVLGIDGGGTKTVAWLATRGAGGEETVLGRGSAGPSNPQAIGFEAATESLARAIDAAFAAASCPPARVAAVCFGMAGVDREAERQHIRDWAQRRNVAERIVVVTDAVPLLHAGTPHGAGVVLIAGTGSVAFGRNAEGASERAGGWGYLFGDEGSAYLVALEGLRAAARAVDGRGPATDLVTGYLMRLELTDPYALIPTIYNQRSDRPALAALADVVVQTAERGDAVAGQIMTRAADELADLVETVARKLHPPAQPFPLALAGGLLLGSSHLRDELQRRLTARGLQPRPVTPVTDPVWGAVLIARQEAHVLKTLT